ncbi:MAG TPA: biotin-dependent carboxyltransferase family protein [Anaeromyxobacteraceae bacterium]|nr:biotin-dependent carboxyltransferase family protein [Anaeromyxobacteraceae bacterium]
MIAVVKAGLLTTVQDGGRPGHRASGMPVAGAMDRLSLAAANLLAGNAPGTAALELTLVGGTFRFEAPALAALAGADMRAALDGRAVAPWSSFRAPAGGVLALGMAASGVRAYLAVHGGIEVPPVLGSRSTYARAGVGGFHGRALRAGDRLPAGAPAGPPPELASLAPGERPEMHPPGVEVELRMLLGPQDDLVHPEGMEALLSTRWTVTPLNDRMGYRLGGPPVRLRGGADIVTDALVPGAVQVSNDGRPIVIMVDGQTTGGYLKPGVVIGPDLRRLAQARTGDGVRFRRCTMQEALEAVADERARWGRLARRLGREAGGRGGETWPWT